MAMYEETQPAQPSPGRRILWIVLWLIVIVVVAWVFIWLIFFRHHTTNTGKLIPSSGSNQSNHSIGGSNSKSSSGGSSSGKGSANKTGTSTGSSGANGSSQPPQLANTGAGDVMVPVAMASVAGSALYYIRLRKKLSTN